MTRSSFGIPSTLTIFASDNRKLERLRKRAEAIGYEVGEGLCVNCDAKLTGVDLDLGECSQCGVALVRIGDEGDET